MRMLKDMHMHMHMHMHATHTHTHSLSLSLCLVESAWQITFKRLLLRKLQVVYFLPRQRVQRARSSVRSGLLF